MMAQFELKARHLLGIALLAGRPDGAHVHSGSAFYGRIRFEPVARGIRLRATNGHMAGQLTAEHAPVEFDPFSIQCAPLIPFLNSMRKANPNSQHDKVTFSVSLTRGMTTANHRGATLTLDPDFGSFPTFEFTSMKPEATALLGLNAEYLMTIAKAYRVVVGNGAETFMHTVAMDLSGEKGIIRVRDANISPEVMECFLMPCNVECVKEAW